MGDLESDDDGFGSTAASSASVHTLASTPAVASLSHAAEEVLDRTFFNRFLRDLSEAPSPVQPWGVGACALMFPAAASSGWPFVSPPMLHVLRPPTAREAPPAKAPSAKRPAFPVALRRLARVPLPLTDDALRHRALLRWRVLVEMDLEASALGRQLSSLCDSLRPEADSQISECLDDTFSGKATGILAKWSASLMSFFEWCHKQGVSRPLLVQEKNVYLFVKHLEREHSPPTRAETFRTSLSFAGATLGLVGATEASASARVVGSCRAQFLTRNKQSP